MIKKDHWYWVRYKYTSSITVAQPYRVINGKADGWSLPYSRQVHYEKDNELEIIQEIPFPQSIFPRSQDD